MMGDKIVKIKGKNYKFTTPYDLPKQPSKDDFKDIVKKKKESER